MSKNIIIQEGGVGKQFTADKLKTNLVGGGACLWVPENETQLGTKYISENGTYRANDDGYYGYSEVTVSGIGVASGKDPDGSGDDAVAEADPSTGEITIVKVPSRIEVITPPTNPYGVYQNGQAVTTEGMVVKAYLNSGSEYGVVPNSEITLNPITAIYDPSTDYGPSGKATSDLNTSLVQPISYAGQAIREGSPDSQGRTRKYIYETTAIAGYRDDGNRMRLLYASASAPAYMYYEISPGGEIQNRRTGGNTSYTYDGKTVYYGSINDLSGYIVPMNAENGSGSEENSAWTMIYGTKEEKPAGSHQQITVLWPRPGDGKVLETTFEILVAPGYTPGGGE